MSIQELHRELIFAVFNKHAPHVYNCKLACGQFINQNIPQIIEHLNKGISLGLNKPVGSGKYKDSSELLSRFDYQLFRELRIKRLSPKDTRTVVTYLIKNYYLDERARSFLTNNRILNANY